MWNMLRSLRFRLTVLYLLASLGLVVLLGAGTYGLLSLYFQRSTDLALQYKMATEFRVRGLSMPSELAAAEQAWTQGSHRPAVPTPSPTPTPILFTSGEGDSEGETEGLQSPPQPVTGQVPSGSEEDDRYDGSLAPVFIVPAAGEVSSSGAPAVTDPAAISQALQAGSDMRTIRLDNGTRLRLLTYRISSQTVLQAGRLLTDQDRLLSQYLTGLLILGSAASLVMALASWALAGRSIKPSQRAWDQQQQFISNASHELRTPLTILRASADYALRSPSTEEREKSLRDILDECDYMNRMVEDLLLLSRLDAHRLTLAADIVPLPDLLAEIARTVEKLAAAKGVTLALDAAQGTVRGDRVRLRQVLLILLDNALRFTPAGGTVRLGAQASGREVVVHVSDSGAGIPPKHLAHVFERFYQVPGQPDEGRGNGLGLSIARGLVEAQHGKITMSSQAGKGTTVQIVLPAAGD
jgi:signal transduction histidine kinase